MDTVIGWDTFMPCEWLVSKTFPYHSINDLRSLRAVNTALKGAIDSFVDALPGNFQAILGTRAFSVLSSYLSLNDFCNLNIVSKGCRFSVRAHSTSLPHDVRALVSSWCRKNHFALLMYSLECYHPRHPDSVLYHPPFLKLSLGPMTFDKHTMKLKGQPLQEVEVNNSPPPNLGRMKPFVCAANDSGSAIFYCGGESFVDGNHDETWLSPIHLSHAYTATSGLFDTSTGLWRQLPPMPEPRSGGVACRIGRRVFVFGGFEPVINLFGVNVYDRPSSDFVLVFDLDDEQWILDHGIEDYQGGYDEFQAAVAVDTETAVIMRRRQVLSLNIKRSKWTRLPDLPMRVGAIIACHIIEHPTLIGPTLVAVGKNSWATLLLSTPREEEAKDSRWEIEPDLCGFGLKVMRFHKNTFQVFSGSSWTWMESDDITRTSYYGGRLLITRSNHGPTVGFVQCSLKAC
ncbi:hypothetical protein HJC23_007402 [Cyclotella cryptica]|uniref:F-box domain-containing protein n=1 Tax=Cyclotella cryptica TaxID=29204 RepID=A0ABD3QHP6_9STRA|eukprot:CCRYP_005125-RA/>CCRYP_005125-RA protein AED:0.03 eAED:0.03 QI:204/1/1/1/0/0.5/2/345/456